MQTFASGHFCADGSRDGDSRPAFYETYIAALWYLSMTHTQSFSYGENICSTQLLAVRDASIIGRLSASVSADCHLLILYVQVSSIKLCFHVLIWFGECLCECVCIALSLLQFLSSYS